MRFSTAGSRPERLWVCACLATILSAAAMQAASLPLWFDELATYAISGAPTAGAVFDALRAAADAQPPVVYFLTRALRACFGDSELAVRGQALLGFGLMLGCVYALVRRRAPAAYGLAAMLFAALTWGFEYAHEARPYALVMGLCVLSLLLWDLLTAARKGRRGLLAGLALTLALLLSSHYYAVLLLIPLGAGELVRSVRRRRADWPVWLALVLPLGVLGFYLPFIQAVRAAYQENFFSRADWTDCWGFYLVLLAPAFFSLLAAMAAAGIVGWRWDPAPPGDDPVKRGSLYEPPLRAAVLTLAVIPLAYVSLAIASTGAFVYRYPLAALVGVTLVFVDVIHNHYGSGRTKAVGALCAALMAGFVGLRLAPAAQGLASGGELRELKEYLTAIERETAGDAAPVAVSAPQAFAQYAHYASPQLRARLAYWSDPALALEHLKTDSAELALRNLAPWAKLQVGRYDPSGNAEVFYLSEVRGHKYDWITGELGRRRGAGHELRKSKHDTLWRIGGDGSGD